MAKIKISIILFIVLVLLYLFRIWQTTGCKQFRGFYFNPISIKIAVESQINTDTSINRNISRFFHNKISVGLGEFAKSYTSTLQPKFLLEILGPLGLTLVIAAIFQTVKKRNTAGIIHLIITLLFSLILLSSIKPKTLFYLVALAWYSFSFRGMNYLITGNKGTILFVGLVIVTFWYFAFSWQMPSICHEIFFN